MLHVLKLENDEQEAPSYRLRLTSNCLSHSPMSVTTVQVVAKQHIADFATDGWNAAECERATYTTYKVVDIQGVEVVQSTSYRLARKRISYFVEVPYEGEGTYIARIRHYLKVVRSGNGGVLRLAIADLFKAEVSEGYWGRFLQVRRPITRISRRNYPIAVAHITHKVVMCDAAKGKEEYRQSLWRFTAYSNTYVKRDPNLA